MLPTPRNRGQQLLDTTDRERGRHVSGAKIEDTDKRLTRRDRQPTEVAVMRDNDASLGSRDLHDRSIRRAQEAEFARRPYVPAMFSKKRDDFGMNVLVRKKTEIAQLQSFTSLVSTTSLLRDSAAYRMACSTSSGFKCG